MNVFVDTNVLIDYVCVRDEFYEDAKRLFALGYMNKLNLSISSLSIINTMYVGRKYGISTIRKRLKSMLAFVKVCDLKACVVKEALDSNWKDYEDAVQYKCARHTDAHCIVTRNKRDFAGAEIPVYTSGELLSLLQA